MYIYNFKIHAGDSNGLQQVIVLIPVMKCIQMALVAVNLSLCAHNTSGSYTV